MASSVLVNNHDFAERLLSRLQIEEGPRSTPNMGNNKLKVTRSRLS